MEEDEESAEKPQPRWRCLQPLPQSAHFVLGERTKDDIGSISPTLFEKVFRPSEANKLREDDIYFVSLAPWRPPTPEPETNCSWTIVAVKLNFGLGESATIQLPKTSLALPNITKAFEEERPDLKSLRDAEVLVLEVQPLTLQRVFVRLDGDALNRHAEVQEKFGGGFLPSLASTIPKKACGKDLPTTVVQGAGTRSGEVETQLKDQIKAAVRESLGKPAVVHSGDLYPLPLPTHPITHESFPPIEVLICEPVNQGLIVPETDIVIDFHWRRLRSGGREESRTHVLSQSVRDRKEDFPADNPSSHKENEPNQPEGADAASNADAELATSTSDQDDDESSSDSSDDELISLSSRILTKRVPEIASPGSASTTRFRPQRSGATSPGSVFSSFTATTGNRGVHLGRPFASKTLSSKVQDYILHPRSNPDEDDETRVYVDVKLLSRIGCFSGDWARVSVNSQAGEEKDPLASLNSFGGEGTRDDSRAVKIYGLPGLTHTGSIPNPVLGASRRLSNSSTTPYRRPIPTAYMSPILFANLGQPPKVYIAPVTIVHDDQSKKRRRRIASSALPPTAREVTLLRLPTPLSTEKVMQPGILANLKEYFERRRRLVKAGDRIAIAFDINASRIVASMSSTDESGTDYTGLLIGSRIDGWRRKGPTGVAWFQIGQVSSSSSEQDSETIDPAIWGGVACIEPRHTKLMQTGSEHAREPPSLENSWRSYLGKRRQATMGLEPVPSRYMLDFSGQKAPSPVTGRLRELLMASTSPQIEALRIKPLMILLHSTQRGAGKVYNASTACADLGLHLFRIDAWEILTEGGDGGDVKTEGSLRAKADRALTCGEMCTVPLIRHIEALSADRIASALEDVLTNFRCLILTTREIDKISDSVRNLVTHELEISAPDEGERRAILQSAIHERGLRAAYDVDLGATARKTAAMVAGDLANVVDRAVIARRARLAALSESQPGTLVRDVLVSGGQAARCLTTADLDRAVDAARTSFADAIGAPKIPAVAWEDVGGLAHAKHAILETIQLPLEHPELFAKGLKKRSGILLYGPPGTGKTLLAKAIATSFALNFFSVKGPELLNMYIGESEANVRRVFQRARDARPCVVFFDELDAVAPKRGNQGDSGGVMDRIVSQLLAELDGMSSGGGGSSSGGDTSEGGSADGGGGVFVVGATNRPDLLDPALLRPGRFDKMLYLGVAETHEQQRHILEALTRKFALAEGLSLARIAQRLPFTYTGADLYALCADAMLKAMMRQARAVDAKIQAMPGEKITPAQFFDRYATEDDVKVQVTEEDFRAAQTQLVTSVSAKELEHYQRVRKAFESSSIDTSGRPSEGAPPSIPLASGSNVSGSYPQKLMPAMPIPTRRKSAPVHSKPNQRQSSVRKGKRPTLPSPCANGNFAQGSNDESDKAESSEDDDDEAYVTSNDYAITPEHRGDRERNRDRGLAQASWKGKGKARAIRTGGEGDQTDATSGVFQDAADGEDLYGDD